MLKWFKDLFCKESPLQEEAEIVSEAVDLTNEMVEEPTIYSFLMEAIKNEIVEKEEMGKFIRDLDEGYVDYLLSYEKLGYGRISSIYKETDEEGDVHITSFAVSDGCSGLQFKVKYLLSRWGDGFCTEGISSGYTCETDLYLLFETINSLYTQVARFRSALEEYKQTFEDARTLQKLKDCQCKTH